MVHTVNKNTRTPRDTQNYTLHGPLGNDVYHGISNDPERRVSEHERDGKFFTTYSVSAKRSRPRAEQEETNAIHDHQRQNFGIPPQYNEAKVDREMTPSFGLYGNGSKRKSKGNNDFGFRLF